MKWTMLCRRDKEYRFDPADRLVGLAESNRQKVVGHTLVFNRPVCYPDWLFRDGQKEADAPLVWKRINHALLLDREGNPKPAFHAVAKILGDQPIN
jgi:GH35 family endo-1,4-beta-xylanase